MERIESIIEEIEPAATKLGLSELRAFEQGGTSIILKGKFNESDVAVKVLKPPYDKKWLHRIKLEHKVIKRMQHNRIVKCISPGLIELNRHVVLITEFIAGVSLRKYLESKSLINEYEGLFILNEVGGVLEYVHNLGITHRDLHDANIILKDRSINDPIVIDFGTARDFSLNEVTSSNTLYETFKPVGAMSHCAPEKWTSPHDARSPSDLFSLGVMIYKGVTGSVPFKANSYFALCDLIRSGQHKEPRLLRGEISCEFNTLIEDLLNPDILFRLGSAAELMRRCEQINKPHHMGR